MSRKRRVLSSKFKAKVALAAIRGDRTLAQMSSHFSVNGNQISAWKKKLLNDASDLFEDGRKRRQRDEVSDEELFEQIGRLKMELEWLKKKASVFD
jgi:putative transposase